MSEFRKIVEKILRKNEREKFIKKLRQEVTPEYIYHIFHLDEAEKSKYYTEKDCVKEFKEGCIKIENKKF